MPRAVISGSGIFGQLQAPCTTFQALVIPEVPEVYSLSASDSGDARRAHCQHFTDQPGAVVWMLLHKAMPTRHLHTVNQPVFTSRRLGCLGYKGIGLVAMDNRGRHAELSYRGPEPARKRTENLRLPLGWTAQAQGTVRLGLEGIINVSGQSLFVPAPENPPLMKILPGDLTVLPLGLALTGPGRHAVSAMQANHFR